MIGLRRLRRVACWSGGDVVQSSGSSRVGAKQQSTGAVKASFFEKTAFLRQLWDPQEALTVAKIENSRIFRRFDRKIEVLDHVHVADSQLRAGRRNGPVAAADNPGGQVRP